MTHAPANLPKPVICLSMMERLIHDTTPANAALWTPDALNQHHALHRPAAPHLLPEHHPNPATNTLPRQPVTFNSFDDRHDHFDLPLATFPPPTPNPLNSSQQPCCKPYPTQTRPPQHLHPVHPLCILPYAHHCPQHPLSVFIPNHGHGTISPTRPQLPPPLKQLCPNTTMTALQR